MTSHIGACSFDAVKLTGGELTGMSEIKRTTIAEPNTAESVAVQTLEDGSWQQDNVEEKVRGKLVEFAAELQRIKKLREPDQD